MAASESTPVYTGETSVGGEPAVRQLNDLTVTKVAVGPLDNNAYLLRCRATGRQGLIDAANDPDTLLDLVGDNLDWILTTHNHGDHWQALAPVAAATGAATIASAIDAPGIPVPTVRTLVDGDAVELGQLTLKVRVFAGHTDGSVVTIVDAGPDGVHIFTGDCLFPGGIGNTWNDTERFHQLFTSIRDEIFNTYDEAWVYPGHGADTTLSRERASLDDWLARGW